jgi:hypothetical protein
MVHNFIYLRNRIKSFKIISHIDIKNKKNLNAYQEPEIEKKQYVSSFDYIKS